MDRYRATSLFQPSNFVAATQFTVDHHSHLFGAILEIPHTQAARVMAVLGFNFIMVDALHTAMNPETLVAIIQTINFVSEGKTSVLVRVPSHDSDMLIYALDAGASGIIFPQVDTAAEAAAAVQKVRFAYGGGNRSVSPCALIEGITDAAPQGWTAETIADRNVAVICQIESVVGVQNVEPIATTPGVNALMLGSGDLRATLGLPVRGPEGKLENPKFNAAVSQLIAAGKKHQMPLMIAAFRANSAGWLRDFNLVITSLDICSMVRALQEDLTRMKGALCQRGDEKNGNNSNGEVSSDGLNSSPPAYGTVTPIETKMNKQPNCIGGLPLLK